MLARHNCTVLYGVRDVLTLSSLAETDFLRVPGVGGGIQHMIEQYTGRLEASVLKASTHTY